MTNLTNYHSHCLYCDGRANMEDFIRFAISEGFSSYGISSHAPLPFSTAWTMEWDRMDDYLSEFSRLKAKYADEIELAVGLEIDYLNEESNPSLSRFQELPLDYRIGSVHMLYSPEGKAQVAEQIARYMKNAKTIYTGLKDAGFTVYGGVNSPYIWLKTPNDMKSWDFFDFLLNNAGIVGTPGAGFGPSGEGYFRITAFGTYENSLKALDRIKNL